MAAPQQLARDGIGGGDIAAVLGLSKWKGPFDVWARILNQAPGEEALNAAMEWGILLEPKVAEYYARQHGGLVLGRPGLMRHETIPYVMGTPDYLAFNPEARDFRLKKATHGLEIKTAGLRAAPFWGAEGDAIPEEYLLQCQWYMIVSGLKTWDVAVLIGGQDYREYTLVADPDLHALLLAQAAQFWANHVMTGIPPDPGGNEDTQQTIRRFYPRSIANIREATPEESLLAQELRLLRDMLAEAEGQENALKAKLMVAIGNAEGLAGPFGRITWRSSKDSRHVDKDSLIADLTTELGIRIGDPDRAQAIRADMEAKHTAMKPGSRRFLMNWGN